VTDKELKRAKDALRQELRATRDALPPNERARLGALVEDQLLQVVRALAFVMTFLSFGSEVPTEALAERLANEGHRLALPCIEAGEVVPAEYRPGEPLVARTYGLWEPEERRFVEPLELDAIVAPGLGFDRDGRRIGYGAGYYDRLFRRVRPDTLRVGIGFHQQVVDHVPSDRGDELLDMIVTDEEVITCRPGA
jgi:5-formyltetrahydrofolate cyclo-ligase